MKISIKGNEISIPSTFNIDGDEIAILADVPHLLKSIRNSLYNNKEISIHKEFVEEAELPTDKVYWAAIEAVHEFQKDKEWPIAPHLKKEYLKLSSWSKMNVRPAKAVLSK